MRELRLTAEAARDVDDILDASEDRFGSRAADAYRRLLFAAFRDLQRDPARLGVTSHEGMAAGIRLYHMRRSRSRAVTGQGRIGNPRHLIAFRVE